MNTGAHQLQMLQIPSYSHLNPYQDAYQLRHSIVQILHAKQGQTFIQNSAIASVLPLHQWVPQNCLHLLNTTSNLPHQLCFTQSSTLMPAVILSQFTSVCPAGSCCQSQHWSLWRGWQYTQLAGSWVSTLCPVFDVGLSTISHLNPSWLCQGDKTPEQAQVATSLTQVHHALISHHVHNPKLWPPFFWHNFNSK